MKKYIFILATIFSLASCKKTHFSGPCYKNDTTHAQAEKVIRFSNIGCFSTSTEVLRIFKSPSGYSYTLEVEVNNQKKVTKGTCSNEFPEAFDFFEKEGTGYMSLDNCTSISDWTVENAGKTFKIHDGDCKLIGYNKLKLTLN